MKKFHIAISTDNLAAVVEDYSRRLGTKPCLVIADEYALWRTASLNISVRKDKSHAPRSLRHSGWEDSNAEAMTAETDVNGIIWERFTAKQQAAEIREIWSEVDYRPES